jgi:hypothetical protein
MGIELDNAEDTFGLGYPMVPAYGLERQIWMEEIKRWKSFHRGGVLRIKSRRGGGSL